MSKWTWCDYSGNESDHETNFQKDEVGNILQRSGALMTKACQNCKKDFNVKKVEDELKQPVKNYKCTDCDFSSTIAQHAMEHKLENEEHKMKITTKRRVVGKKVSLEGTANIRYTKDDILILCDTCNVD